MTSSANEMPDPSLRREECMRLVERVAASQELRRAARLRAFLLYVSDQALNGASIIPEQQIGAAVFDRPEVYDTSTDNIVRVNATELRKRLLRYFEEEGAAEEITLDIPRGSYAPTFRRRLIPRSQASQPSAAPEHVRDTPPSPNPGEDEPVSDPHEADLGEGTLPPSPSAPPQHRFQLRAWQTASFLLALACLVLLWQIRSTGRQAQPLELEPALDKFWAQFFHSSPETDLVLADNSFDLAEDIMQRTISLDDYLNYNYKRLAESPDLPPGQRADLALVLDRNNGSIAEFRVAEQILALNRDPRQLALRFAREFTAGAAKRNSVILVGSHKSNPWVELFADKANFAFEFNFKLRHPFVVNRAPRPGELAIYEQATGPNESHIGFGAVAYLPGIGADGSGSALLLQGTDSQATGAAGDFITSEAALASLERSFPPGPIPHFEVLLRTSKISGTPLHSEIIATRVYPPGR